RNSSERSRRWRFSLPARRYRNRAQACRDERGWLSGACARNRRDGARTCLSDRDRDAGLYHDAAGTRARIGRLHPEFVRRLAAAIAEARAAGLPFAGIFSAYRPPVFGVGRFADKFHSLHTYGLAVDVTGIGAPGTPNALLWHEIAARHGVICPYGPHNLAEWNHCQPTWVKIILSDNPLRETVTADGPINLEDMFETAYSLLATPGAAGAPAADPPAHFFKPPDVRTAVAPGTKAVNRRMASTRTALPSALGATR